MMPTNWGKQAVFPSVKEATSSSIFCYTENNKTCQKAAVLFNIHVTRSKIPTYDSQCPPHTEIELARSALWLQAYARLHVAMCVKHLITGKTFYLFSIACL